jgi:hypothetical protein
VRVHLLGMVLFAAAVAGTTPSTARADDAAGAKELFEHGRDLRGRGDCAGALPLFQKAYALYPPGLGSLRNIAVCQEALGQFASARDSWLELKRALAGTTDSKYAGWNEDVEHAIAKLSPRVARLTTDVVVVTSSGGPATTDGIDVSVDGVALAKDRVGVAVDHDPGTYVVRASGPGLAAPDQQTAVLAPGDSAHVSLHVTLKAEAVAAAPGEAPAEAIDAPVESPGHASPLRTAGWVTLGVGVAGLAGAAVSLVVRQTALSDLKHSCPQYSESPCAPSSRTAVLSDIDRGKAASTAFTVLGAVGVVGAAVGVTLVTASLLHHSPTALVLTPSGVLARGTF